GVQTCALPISGSSSFNRSSKATEKTINMPAIRPMIMASVTPITSAPAVIPTSPPRIPLSTIERSFSPCLIQDIKNVPIPPAEAARQVVTSTLEVTAGSAESTEPPLNPNQPNHNKNAPTVA